MPRYSLERISNKRVNILDSRFNNIAAAVVSWREMADGNGWRIIVHSSARSNGRKLHATVADAVASMKYLSKSQARAALAGQELLEVES
jgi:hypothetical protein